MSLDLRQSLVNDNVSPDFFQHECSDNVTYEGLQHFPVVLDRRKPPSSWMSPIFLYRFTSTFKPGIKKFPATRTGLEEALQYLRMISVSHQTYIEVKHYGRSRWSSAISCWTRDDIGLRTNAAPPRWIKAGLGVFKTTWFNQPSNIHSAVKHSTHWYRIYSRSLSVPISSLIDNSTHTHDACCTNHSCIDTLCTICFITCEWVT